jgi:hypothetical protein
MILTMFLNKVKAGGRVVMQKLSLVMTKGTLPFYRFTGNKLALHSKIKTWLKLKQMGSPIITSDNFELIIGTS